MRARWIALMWLTLVPAAARAQPAEVGERVRVRTTDGARLVATLVEITPSDLGLRREDGDVRISLDRIFMLERSLGERRRFARNFLITTGVAALALGTWAAVADDESCNDEPFGCLSAGESFVVGSILGGIVGAPIGLIVGLSVRSERWELATPNLPAGASSTLTPVGAHRVTLGVFVPVGPKR